MFVTYVNAVAALGLAVLFLAGVCLLGVGLWIFARAMAETQRYRSHRLTTDGQEVALSASEDAVEELERHPSRRREPTDAELREFTRAQTLLGEEPFEPPGDEQYTTTDRNAMMQAGGNGEAEIDADQLYVKPRP